MRQGNGDAGFPVHANGTVADAIAAVLKREGVDVVFGYPRNQILEAAARIDIRTVIVRQERTGLHMADAVSRMSKGGMMGVFVMQQGPGAENAFGGVAQAFADSIPVLVMPQGYALSQAYVPYNFNSVRSMASVAKHAEPLTSPGDVTAVMRRAEARFSASMMISSSIRWSLAGAEVDWMTNTSSPRTFSCTSTKISMSAKRRTMHLANGVLR